MLASQKPPTGGAADDLFDLGTLRVRRQMADLHVLDHATVKRAHRRLCEMNSATWRRRIVMRRSRQTRKRCPAGAAKRNFSNWGFPDLIEELPRTGLVQRPLLYPRLVIRREMYGGKWT